MKCLLGQVRWVLLLNLPISWNKWRCLVQKSVCVNLWPKLNVPSSLVRNGNCQVVRLPSVQPADSNAELCKLRRTRNGWPECAECVVFCNGEGSWTCTHDWGIPWGNVWGRSSASVTWKQPSFNPAVTGTSLHGHYQKEVSRIGCGRIKRTTRRH